MYDAAIIGSGPAGISAALSLKLHNKNVIWFGSGKLSGKVEKSEKIANYPGVPMVTGEELNGLFLKQTSQMGIDITEKTVTKISSSAKGFMVLGGNEIYEAKTVLLATGAVSAKGFPGEAELLGRGVSYCATCDGFLYKNKTVAVFCGDKKYEHEVDYLASVAEKVYLFTPYKDCTKNNQNVIIINKPIKEITGGSAVNGVVLTDGSEIAVSGVFILRDCVAPGVLVNGLLLDGVHINVNRNMETNKKGCFAAGDCTGRPYQIAKAVGEGNVAAHSIIEYLSETEK